MTGGSLRLRLILAGTLSIAAALALAAVGLTILFERHVERRLVAELAVQLDQLLGGIDRDAAGALAVGRYPGDPRFAQPLSGLYWQIEAPEATLRSRSLWDAALALPADVLANGQAHVHHLPGPAEATLLVVERGVVLPRRLGATPARVAVAVDRAEIAAASAAFRADLLPYLAVIGALLAAASVAQVGVGLRPLRAVATRVAAVRSGATTRVGGDFPTEVAPLARELDGLLAAREADVEKARARAADLAHGLRTPLQALAGDVARLRAKGETALAADVEAVLAAMSRHVERELARARLAGRSQGARADAVAAAERVVAVVRRTPDGAAKAWRIDAPEAGLAARIDADDLTEALGNLVENAARHARTRVVVALRDGGGRAVVAVHDDGPGIAPEALEAALARGGRFDARGSGAGLGLAIVQDVAEAWGGALACETTPDGFVATLTLPAVEPERTPAPSR